MSTDSNAPESQFQKVGDLVECDDDTGVMQVESLCMNCHENGTTRLLLPRVPFFRDIILESFECPHCFFKDNSLKSAGQIQELGSKYTLEVEAPLVFSHELNVYRHCGAMWHPGLAKKWDRFSARLEKAINGGLKFVITLVDPLANSYVQDLRAPAPDPQLTVEEYTRTEEEEDDLGLKDMKTEGYEDGVQENQKGKPKRTMMKRSKGQHPPWMTCLMLL
ncbi:zinc finger protein ZPR1 [Penicillium riverlandense]|uniref:zinc finger protein ZPR1 n=1 Tax=Penicillium riverlandense TaxID=1903569 RepID=UPI0025495EF5|nr:zinc finger protein ZPR1 [Penicillium riverlandense]KAJ5808650.1 zinc finger protein ZPR1 [Penicillium riverlandense]